MNRFEVSEDGSIAGEAQALNTVRLWVLRTYRAEVSRNGGTGSSVVLMEFLTAMADSARLREEVAESAPLAVPDTSGTEKIEVSVVEASRLLGCSPGYVRRLLREGKLAGRRVGRDWLVDASRIDLQRPGRAS